MTGPARAVLALDLGGTKLAAAVVEEPGVLRRRRSEATRAEEGAEDVLRRAVALAGAWHRRWSGLRRASTRPRVVTRSPVKRRSSQVP